MSQTATAPKSIRIPSAITKQASTHQLGELTRRFKPTISNPLLILAILIGGSTLDIIVMVEISHFIGFVFFILLFIPLILLFWAVRALRSSNVRVYIFKNGFIYAKGRKRRAVLWSQVVAVMHKQTAGRYSSTHTYTVRPLEGRDIKISDAVNRVIDLGTIIQREANKHLLPKAIASYKNGENISFGKINVNTQGLNNSLETIPWDQIGSIEVRSGLVIAEKLGRLVRWSPVRAQETPNIYVLQNLVSYVVKNL